MPGPNSRWEKTLAFGIPLVTNQRALPPVDEPFPILRQLQRSADAEVGLL